MTDDPCPECGGSGLARDLLAAIPTDLLAAVLADRSGPVLFEGTTASSTNVCWVRTRRSVPTGPTGSGLSPSTRGRTDGPDVLRVHDDGKGDTMTDTTRLRRYVPRIQAIEAIQWTGDADSWPEIEAFAPGKVRTAGAGVSVLIGKDGDTQGWVTIGVGGWLVREPGDPSDIWPVDSDDFDAEYQPEDPEQSDQEAGR